MKILIKIYPEREKCYRFGIKNFVGADLIGHVTEKKKVLRKTKPVKRWIKTECKYERKGKKCAPWKWKHSDKSGKSSLCLPFNKNLVLVERVNEREGCLLLPDSVRQTL